MNRNNLNYKEYYLRAIWENCNGFKPVHGGTGLGKTYGIEETIKADFGDRKYIYVAHRKNLLREMCDSLTQKKIGHVLLKSDEDQLRYLLADPQLKRELIDFCKSPLVKNYVTVLNEKGKNGSVLLKRAQASIIESQRLFDLSQKSPAVDFQDKIDNNVSNIYQFVKKILIDANRIAEGIGEPKKQLTKNDYAHLLVNYKGMLDQLFPFISFLNDVGKKALILTIHKLFHGLFSGKKTLRINNLRGYVIFLDEFDFLEPILLAKICDEVPIEDPFLMLNYFKSNTESKIKTLTYPVGEHHEEIRQKLRTSLRSIDKLNTPYQFPEVRHFTTNDDKLFGNWIFLTNQTIVDKPIYLKIDEERATFEVTSKANRPETIDGFPLLRTVLNTSSSILRSFAGWKDRNNEIFEEILFDVLGRTEFQRTIRKIPFYHSLASKNQQFVNNYTHLLDRGMGVFTLNKPHDPTEPKEVKIGYYNIPSSPEKILLSLIKKNLVFGLSATSKLNRVVDHFDEHWLKEQIEYLADNNIRYFEDNELDKELIQKLTAEKTKIRNNAVLVESIVANCPNEIKSELEDLEEKDTYGIRSNGGYDKNRVIGFFKILEWISQKLDNGVSASCIKSHLVFLNSLKQIEFFLKHTLHGLNSQKLDGVLSVTTDKSLVNIGYQIQFKGRVFYIVLLEGKAHEIIYPDNIEGLSNTLKLFWKEHPVIFLTTYPSAANGVNLQYYLSEKDWENKLQEDFRCIHLLEGPHFYFANHYADHSMKYTESKKDLWKATKLHMNAPVSMEKFKYWMGTILSGKLSWKMNRDYKKHSDFILNQMATYFQALGRMERVRNNTGTQYVTLSPEIRSEFETYQFDDRFSDVRDDYSPYYSGFLKQVLVQIEQHKKLNIPSVIKETKLEIEEKSKKNIDEMVTNLRRIQLGECDEKEFIKVKEKWYSLRKIALRHEFNNPVIQSNHVLVYNYSCFEKHKERLNSIYRKVKEVDELNLHFQNHGYSLKRTSVNENKWFTDHFTRSILIAVVAEESVKAFLNTNNIKFSTPESVAQELFEIADLYLNDYDIFVDAKNFSQKSIHNRQSSNLKEDNWVDDDSFRKKVIKKLTTLRKIRPNSRLAIVNLHFDSLAAPCYATIDNKTAEVMEDWDVAFIPNLIESNNGRWSFSAEIIDFIRAINSKK